MIYMDHISIVIVNYNSEEHTRECLVSLEKIKAENFNYQVIVVDNGSQKIFKLPKQLQTERVEVIRSESNLGFTGGNNLGMTYAIEKYNSEYICLLNNDTTVHPHFLEELRQTLVTASPKGMVGPKIYFSKGFEFHKDKYPRNQLGNIIWYGGGSIDWPNLIDSHRCIDEIDRGQLEHETHSDFCTGACVLISREVLETIGMFDEQLFLYNEDTDLSVRAKKRGYQILFNPRAVIWHKNAGSSGGSGSPIHEYYQTRNRIYFGLKHGSFRVKLTSVSLLVRMLLHGNAPRRKAAYDMLMGNLGKEAYDRI